MGVLRGLLGVFDYSSYCPPPKVAVMEKISPTICTLTTTGTQSSVPKGPLDHPPIWVLLRAGVPPANTHLEVLEKP